MAGRAVEQDLDAADAHGGDGVGVDGDHGDKVLGLGARVIHHAAAVEQDQRVAGSQSAQVDRGGVAAGVIQAADGAGGVERDIAQLWDGAEQIVARGGGDRVELVRADDGDRQGIGGLRADDLAADNDDDIAVVLRRLTLGRRLLCEGGAGQRDGGRRHQQHTDG